MGQGTKVVDTTNNQHKEHPSQECKDLWQEIITVLAETNDYDLEKINRTFGRVKPLKLTQHELTVGCPNQFNKNWVERGYLKELDQILSNMIDDSLHLSFVVDESLVEEQIVTSQPDVNSLIDQVYKSEQEQEPIIVSQPQEQINAGGKQKRSSSIKQHTFNKDYTFSSFIRGDSNQFACSVAMAVAEEPGLRSNYNPLFISGGPGLGKTHLLQAIGNYVTEFFPNKRVVYVTAEEFFNNFMLAVRDVNRDKKMNDFHELYRKTDIFLIDDVQFLEGKASGTEQLFHTFNALIERKAQVVIAADRSPEELDMAERMTTRFAQGLCVDVLPPSYEVRHGIIKNAFDQINLTVDKDVIEYLASQQTRSVREIESAIHLIIAYSEISKINNLTLPLTKQITANHFKNQIQKVIKIPTIQAEVCKSYGINNHELVGSKRSRNIVLPRHIAMYLSREMTEESLPSIGSHFGGKDHTTVMHAINNVKEMIKKDPEVYQQVEHLMIQIKKH